MCESQFPPEAAAVRGNSGDPGLTEWLRRHHGTRTGTFTFNGVTYTDMNEVEWRQATGIWR